MATDTENNKNEKKFRRTTHNGAYEVISGIIPVGWKDEIDRLVDSGNYANRAEFVRIAIGKLLGKE